MITQPKITQHSDVPFIPAVDCVLRQMLIQETQFVRPGILAIPGWTFRDLHYPPKVFVVWEHDIRAWVTRDRIWAKWVPTRILVDQINGDSETPLGPSFIIPHLRARGVVERKKVLRLNTHDRFGAVLRSKRMSCVRFAPLRQCKKIYSKTDDEDWHPDADAWK